MLAEELRQQALRVIGETTACQVIRRALLRKTKPNKEESKGILPRSLAAYWRWTKRAAGKKRVATLPRPRWQICVDSSRILRSPSQL